MNSEEKVDVRRGSDMPRLLDSFKLSRSVVRRIKTMIRSEEKGVSERKE